MADRPPFLLPRDSVVLPPEVAAELARELPSRGRIRSRLRARGEPEAFIEAVLNAYDSMLFAQTSADSMWSARVEALIESTPDDPSAPADGSDPDEWISSAEAAELLDLSQRQVLNLADELEGTQVGGRWVFLRSTVEAYAAA